MRGLGTTVLNAALSVVVALIGVQGLAEAPSWREGELFLAPRTLAIGATALGLSVAGCALGLIVVLRWDQPAPASLGAWAAVSTVLAVMATGAWLFLVLVSASSD